MARSLLFALGMFSVKAAGAAVLGARLDSEESATRVAHGEQDFSLVLGGPLFQLLRRAHLSDGALTLLRKRIFVISLTAWLPLLVLSTLQHKLSNGVVLPFVKDLEVHVRFLVALPLLIVAELVVHRRMRGVIRLFRDRRIIAESDLGRFDATVESALRLRNSVIAELVLVAIVYGFGVAIVWRHFVALGTMSWYATPTASGTTLTFAGIWYGYVSMPIYQFIDLPFEKLAGSSKQ